ncbi:MAG: hypothetical protein NTY15_09590 [Planctomycetota bacterium]|nr:hypothetical protein [Planctomycetota bacterium]
MSVSNIAAQNEIDNADLMGRLGRFVLRSNLVAAAKIVLIGSAAWLGFLLLAMTVDSFSEMSATSRRLCGRGSLLVTIVVGAVCCIRTVRKTSKGRLAYDIDSSQGTGGQIMTGWDLLRNRKAYDAPLTAKFAKQAILQSVQRLSTISPSAVIPLKAIQWPAYSVLGLIAFIALIALVSPPLAWIQFKRFAYPSIETTPFTGVTISLDNTKHSLRYGDDVKIIATVSKKATHRLELVTVSKDGKELVLPMLPRGESKWQALLTDVKEPAQFFARSGRTQSEMGMLDVQLTPKITEAVVRITPLAYTRQAVYEGKIPDSGITGLAGTQVEFYLTSNRPLKHGRMQLTYDDKSESPVELSVNSAEANSTNQSNSVSCSLTLERDGNFSIKVTDIDGLQSAESVQGKIVILTDQRPIVRILEPRPVSLATPDIDLPVSISAEDDFGITQLRLYRSLNGSPARPIDLPFEPAARANVVVPLPLNRFGLVPGDEIDLFARTEDNDPAGPKGAESPKTTIRIISIEEFQERMLEQRGAEALSAKYEAAQRQLENVSTAMAEAQEAADRAAADPTNEALQQELHEKLKAAEQAAQSAAKAIDKLAQNPLDIDIDRELSEMLSEIARETRETADQFSEMAKSQSGKKPLTESEQEKLKELREKTKADRDQLQEEAIDPLNELSKTLPLMEDKERFEELVERQKELAQRMQSLADADANDPSNERRMMEMEAAQDALRQELNELAEDMAENAEQLPETDEFSPLKESAMKLAQDIKQSGAPELMNDAQKSLLKSKFKQATENAKAAAESLDALQPENNTMGNEAENSLKGAFPKPGKGGGSKLGKTLDQLKQRMNPKGQKPGQGQGGGKPGEPGGRNNGFSARSPRQQNTGMYGSMPTPSPSSQGRSDKVSQGAATQSAISMQGTGQSGTSESQSSEASGQSQLNVPTQYRQRVSEYYRRINEQLKSK